MVYVADGFAFFDSLAVEAGGNICVATLDTSVVTVVSPDGKLLDRAAVAPGDDPSVTNLCFGGVAFRRRTHHLGARPTCMSLTGPGRGLR